MSWHSSYDYSDSLTTALQSKKPHVTSLVRPLIPVYCCWLPSPTHPPTPTHTHPHTHNHTHTHTHTHTQSICVCCFPTGKVHTS